MTTFFIKPKVLKPSILVLIVFTMCCSLSCKKNSSGVILSGEEKKLLGHWDLRQVIIEESGQPTITNNINSPINCFMEFKNGRSPIENPRSEIFSNTKAVNDNKDCSWLANAWKITNDDKLLLASLDTVYATILFTSVDSLALKRPYPGQIGKTITYCLKK